jgi:hypothetical protein
MMKLWPRFLLIMTQKLNISMKTIWKSSDSVVNGVQLETENAVSQDDKKHDGNHLLILSQ